VTVELLEAELAAIDLWDRLYLDLSDPPKVETDACATRMLRRCQIAVELHSLEMMLH
jgi:hypothetical protein